MKAQMLFKIQIKLKWDDASFDEETYFHSTHEGAVAELLQTTPALKTTLQKIYKKEKMNGYEGSFKQWEKHFFYGDGANQYGDFHWLGNICFID